MTDKDHLPVKKMTAETSHRELRSAHRNSTYNTKERHVRISRYWTEEYMIVIQYNEESAINDIFVWEWDEVCKPFRILSEEKRNHDFKKHLFFFAFQIIVPEP